MVLRGHVGETPRDHAKFGDPFPAVLIWVIGMLKLLDFSRWVGAGIKCTACGSTRCRLSKWRSKNEKLAYDGYRPYRCDDCENRFFAASSASLERTLINSAAYVLIGLALLVTAEFWLGHVEDSEIEGVRLATVVDADESMTAPPPRSEVKRQTDAPAPLGNEHRDDPAIKVKLLHKAATEGHPGAMVQLGRILATADNYPADPAQAAKWMQLAAATGNPEGMYELGRFYRDGVGLTPEPVRAYIWFSRAAAARHVDAAHERDKLVRTMSDEELKEAHAQALLR